jgi:hypothetical protein
MESRVTVPDFDDALVVVGGLKAERFELESKIEALRATLAPFAQMAREYDDHVYPDSPDSQTISVPLGLLRAAREALTS